MDLSVSCFVYVATTCISSGSDIIRSKSHFSDFKRLWRQRYTVISVKIFPSHTCWLVNMTSFHGVGSVSILVDLM